MRHLSPVQYRAILVALCLMFWGCGAGEAPGVGDSSVGQVSAAEGENKPRSQNRLAEETSPYLLLHAHNPVDWYPWGPEAFAKAKKENKPIFLSIGYSSCYWCHVMERKVFSDPKIAKYMNEHFVNIKVDREERPDIDDIYMTALGVYFQAIGAPQSGGWPLSMFLTPDAKPFVGGTYFPPVEQGGRISFPGLAEKVSGLWEGKPEQVAANADFLTEHLQNALKVRPSLKPVKLDRGLLESVLKAVAENYDEEYGGFGFNPDNDRLPKFPTPTKLALLQYEATAHDDKVAAKMVLHTLDQMAAGGIRDHLGGGFHRYSTDRYWRVPHFEKMLYDNAQLADIYVEAFRQTGTPRYQEIAEEIYSFLLRDMTSREGGFYSAIDAETEAVEGKSYLWTPEQIAQVLSAQDAEVFARAYGVSGDEDLHGGHVLQLVDALPDLAAELNISVDDLKERLAGARAQLLAARKQREAPLKDDKMMTDWNGLTIRALANGGAVLGRPRYIKAAERAAMFLLSEMRDKQGRLLHVYRSGKAKVPAYVDDYAYLVEGMIALYQATADKKWLNAARRLTDLQIELFWDKERGGCFFTSHDHEKLIARGKQGFDSARPSGNSVTVRNLIRLASLTGEPSYRKRATEALNTFAPFINRAPQSTTNMALAAAEFIDSPDFNLPAIAIPPQSAAPPLKSAILFTAAQKSAKKKKKKPEYVTGKVFLTVKRLPAGQTCEVMVVLKIKKKWHIDANPASDEFALPTEFKLKSKLGTKLSKIRYPKGKKITVPGFEKPHSVYEEQAALRGTLEIPAAAAGKKEELQLIVRYQACDDKKCLRPTNLVIKVPLEVAAEGETVKQINQKLFHPKKKKSAP